MTYDPANPNNKLNPFRNLRPEMDPTNLKHRAFMLMPEAYDDVRHRCLHYNALHRLAFVTAAMEVNGPFIDVRQESCGDPVPYPEHGEKFTAIIGDRTTTSLSVREVPNPAFKADFAVSKGPDAYDQPSLKALFKQAAQVTIDVTGTGYAPTYMAACAPTAMHGQSCILIETTVEMAPHWAHFVNEFAGEAKKILVDSDEVAAAALAEEAPIPAGTLLN